MDTYAVHERFRQIRDDKNLSRTKFADALGLTRGVIENIELKKVDDVKDLYVELVCAKLNVNERWLRTGKGQMYSENIDEDELMKLAATIAKIENKDTYEVFKTLIADERFLKFMQVILSLKEPFFTIAEEQILALKKHSDG